LPLSLPHGAETEVEAEVEAASQQLQMAGHKNVCKRCKSKKTARNRNRNRSIERETSMKAKSTQIPGRWWRGNERKEGWKEGVAHKNIFK